MRIHYAVMTGLVLLLIAACAKIQPPPGGPEDLTSPHVVSVTPEPGTVNVPRDTEIQVEFSEPILRQRVEDAIYVSPRPAGEMSIGGGGRWLHWRWDDSLAANTTYLLTLAPRIPDRRNNQMRASFVWAFSTGAVIDSGEIHGNVYQDRVAVPNAQVLAFTLPIEHDSVYFGDPAYMTESGEGGNFAFEFLSAGSYRLLGIKDQNKNRRLDRGEAVGVATFDPEITSTNRAVESVSLHLRSLDTSAFIATRAKVTNDRILAVEFSRSVDTTSLQAASWYIHEKKDSVVLAIDELLLVPDDRTKVLGFISGAEAGNSYRLAIANVTSDGQPLDSAGRTVEFFWPTAVDTTPPEVLSIWPPDKSEWIPVACTVSVTFSEHLAAPTGEELRVVDTSGVPVAGMLIAATPWHWRFMPDSELDPHTEYVVFLDTATVSDEYGNLLPEAFRSRFATADPRQAGTISGTIETQEPEWSDTPLILNLISTTNRQHLYTAYLPRTGSYEQTVPAGYYVIEVVVDLNRNGRFDPGNLQPFFHAEPWFAPPDTVEVRARFETESVDLTIP